MYDRLIWEGLIQGNVEQSQNDVRFKCAQNVPKYQRNVPELSETLVNYVQMNLPEIGHFGLLFLIFV